MKKKKRNILLTAQIFKILKGPLVIQRALVLKAFFFDFFLVFFKMKTKEIKKVIVVSQLKEQIISLLGQLFICDIMNDFNFYLFHCSLLFETKCLFKKKTEKKKNSIILAPVLFCFRLNFFIL